MTTLCSNSAIVLASFASSPSAREHGQITRKLENTLGLFLSINGFQDSAVEVHSQNRPVLLLMDGSDLAAVLQDRISLPELLMRKRQHAARTGAIPIRAYELA